MSCAKHYLMIDIREVFVNFVIHLTQLTCLHYVINLYCNMNNFYYLILDKYICKQASASNNKA